MRWMSSKETLQSRGHWCLSTGVAICVPAKGNWQAEQGHGTLQRGEATSDRQHQVDNPELEAYIYVCIYVQNICNNVCVYIYIYHVIHHLWLMCRCTWSYFSIRMFVFRKAISHLPLRCHSPKERFPPTQLGILLPDQRGWAPGSAQGPGGAAPGAPLTWTWCSQDFSAGWGRLFTDRSASPRLRLFCSPYNEH